MRAPSAGGTGFPGRRVSAKRAPEVLSLPPSPLAQPVAECCAHIAAGGRPTPEGSPPDVPAGVTR
jgi:hypothetical protein